MMVEKLIINDLLIRIKDDDEEALEALYDIIYPVMQQVAKKILIDDSQIEDIVSEAFLKIYQKAYSFRKDMDGLTWITQIVKNQSLDYNKWYTKVIRISDEEIDLFNFEDRNTTDYINLRYALKKLSPKEYEILQLKYWHSYTLKDIAEKYGYSLSKIYRIYTSAMNKLKKMLKENDR